MDIPCGIRPLKLATSYSGDVICRKTRVTTSCIHQDLVGSKNQLSFEPTVARPEVFGNTEPFRRQLMLSTAWQWKRWSPQGCR